MKTYLLQLMLMIYILLLSSCSFNSGRINTTVEDDKREGVYVNCSSDSQILALKNFNTLTQKVENDNSGGVAYIHFLYNNLNEITRISFMSQDSNYGNWAYKDFEYDQLNRLSRITFLDAEEKEIFESQNFYYNSQGQIQKIVMSDTVTRFGVFGPEVIKFAYDDKNRISSESYFSFEGNQDIIGEMGIKSISYRYDLKGQLIESIFHYTGTTKPEDPAKHHWLNEYIYNNEGELIQSKYKFDRESDEYDNITHYVYDKENQLYGRGKDKEKIIPSIAYCDIKNIVFQNLYSDYFHTNPKYRGFKN